MRTVIFDLDGTLADTSGDLIAAANAALGQAALTVADDAATAFQGGRAMLRLGLGRMHGTVDEDTVNRLYPVLLDHYGDHIDRFTTLYPGAMQAVAALKSAGHPVGICTNKPESLAHKLLTRLGVLDEFAALIGGDTLPVRKPHPKPLRETVRLAGGDPANAVLIGDTITDRDTARAAGVPCVLVTFGPLGQGVADMSPDALLADYVDLPGIIHDLG